MAETEKKSHRTFDDFVGKFLRLRGEFTRASDPGHKRRLFEEMQRLERWLGNAGLTTFADTRPLEDG